MNYKIEPKPTMSSQQGLEYVACIPSRSVRLSCQGVSCYDPKLHPIVKIQFRSSGEDAEPFLFFPLLLVSGPLWLGMVVSVRVSSIGQIDLFRNYLY